jgi:hypothetical protein
MHLSILFKFDLYPGFRRRLLDQLARRLRDPPALCKRRRSPQVGDAVWHPALRRRRHLHGAGLRGQEPRRAAGCLLRLHEPLEQRVHHRVDAIPRSIGRHRYEDEHLWPTEHRL